MSDIIFAKGNVKNVLKRIGAYKSNLFCFGEDPITKSGVIVSNGEIISSRILDINLIAGGASGSMLSYSKNYINHIDVKYVDYNDKEIKTMSFNILDNDALIEIVKFIAEKQQDKENIEKIEKNQIIFDEKLKKIQQFLVENKEQIQCIGDLKNQILDMNNKLDVLLSERTLRH